MSDDAQNFLLRQEQTAEKQAKVLNEKHYSQQARVNADLATRKHLVVGDKVWYLRPPDSGSKLDGQWLWPAVVVAREGAQ